MEFVDDDKLQARKIAGSIFIGQKQGQRFRRCHQKIRRLGFLPLAAGGWRVTGSGFKTDRQVQCFNRRLDIPVHINGQRLERRDIERVKLAR